MVSFNGSWTDPLIRTLWRSEFVECIHERANNSISPQICLEDNKMFCCYNNALLGENDHCCTFDEFVIEHRALFNFLHLCVWINLIIFVVIIFLSLYLIFHSKEIIADEKSDNEDLIKSINKSFASRNLGQSTKETTNS